MEDPFYDVQTFMLGAGQTVREDIEMPASKPRVVSMLRRHSMHMAAVAKQLKDQTGDERAFRAALVVEEAAELLLALSKGDEVETADALVDLCYVALGAGVQFGLPLHEVWHEVHDANLRKLYACTAPGCNGGFLDDELMNKCVTCKGSGYTSIRDASGKVVKPEGWTPPDVRSVLDSWRADGADAVDEPMANGDLYRNAR